MAYNTISTICESGGDKAGHDKNGGRHESKFTAHGTTPHNIESYPIEPGTAPMEAAKIMGIGRATL